MISVSQSLERSRKYVYTIKSTVSFLKQIFPGAKFHFLDILLPSLKYNSS